MVQMSPVTELANKLAAIPLDQMHSEWPTIVPVRLSETERELLVNVLRRYGHAQTPGLPLRFCDYCNSWNSKPCGEQCVWMPDMPTLETLASPDTSTAAHAQCQQQWQPIETAPHEKRVLLGWRDWRDHQWCIEAGPATTGQRFGNGYSNLSQHGSATHWQPLPAAPSDSSTAAHAQTPAVREQAFKTAELLEAADTAFDWDFRQFVAKQLRAALADTSTDREGK